MTNNEKLSLLNEKVCECSKCPKLVENRTKHVFGSGNPDAQIVFIGEAPGQDEDQQGVPFVGKSGQLLTNIIKSCGLDRDRDVYICNIVKCRPPSNRAPTEEEANNCRPFLDLQLKVVSPKFIVCLGAVASHNLLNTNIPISRLRKKWHDYNGARVLCTFHPAYLLRNPPAKKDVWEDLQLLLAEIGMSATES